VSVSLKQLE